MTPWWCNPDFASPPTPDSAPRESRSEIKRRVIQQGGTMEDAWKEIERVEASPLQSGAGSVGEEPREISLQAERLLIAYGEAVAESNLKDIDGGSENAELALRNYIATLESRSPSPLVSVETSERCPTCSAPVVRTKGYDNGLPGAAKIAGPDTLHFALSADDIERIRAVLRVFDGTEWANRIVRKLEVGS